MKDKKIISLLFIIVLIFVSAFAPPSRISIGVKAPELAFPNPNGDTLKLSSQQGNLVLLDFWASWCGPCRKKNPEIRNLYNKFKTAKFLKPTTGFEIFSYSLDKSKESWINAIKQDSLIWENHVSDLKFWSGEGARTYGITSIPSTILIDETGYIIAINPSIDFIEKEISKRLKSSKSKASN